METESLVPNVLPVADGIPVEPLHGDVCPSHRDVSFCPEHLAYPEGERHIQEMRARLAFRYNVACPEYVLIFISNAIPFDVQEVDLNPRNFWGWMKERMVLLDTWTYFYPPNFSGPSALPDIAVSSASLFKATLSRPYKLWDSIGRTVDQITPSKPNPVLKQMDEAFGTAHAAEAEAALQFHGMARTNDDSNRVHRLFVIQAVSVPQGFTKDDIAIANAAPRPANDAILPTFVEVPHQQQGIHVQQQSTSVNQA